MLFLVYLLINISFTPNDPLHQTHWPIIDEFTTFINIFGD